MARKKFEGGGASSEGNGLDARTAGRWWVKNPTSPRHELILAAQSRLRHRAQLRERMDLLHMQLYSDMPIQGLGPYSYTSLGPDDDRVGLPLIQYLTDRYVSFLTKSRPKPLALTKQGAWSQRRKGKGLTKWLEGKFSDLKVYEEIDPIWALHSAILGLGLVKVLPVNMDKKDLADVDVEIVMPWEVTVDEAEAQNPKSIRSFFHRKPIDRTQLMEMFPKKKAEIRDLPSKTENEIWGVDPSADLVFVTEAYHLPSAKGANDGLRSVCVQTGLLGEAPWKLSRFPFVPLRRSPMPIGWWGIGIAQMLRKLQMQISQMWADYEEAISLGARPKLLAHRSAAIIPAHLDDQIGSILEWSGPVEPKWWTPGQIMPSDFLPVLQWAWQLGGELVGLSDMRLHGELPPGLRSGAAIREANDVEDSIFGMSCRLWEAAHMLMSELMIETGREVAEVNPKFASSYRGKRQVELVYFRDVLPDEDTFTLKLYPVSTLPTSPAARLEQLSELFNTTDERGERMIDSQTFRALLDYPDLDNDADLKSASYNLCGKLLERFSEAENPEDDGVYIQPEPEWDLAYFRKVFTMQVSLLELEGCPEANIEVIRKFIAACDAEIAKQKPAALPAAPPAGGPPQPAPNAPQAGPQAGIAPPGPMIGAAPIAPAAP
jgi:hypothetical protein